MLDSMRESSANSEEKMAAIFLNVVNKYINASNTAVSIYKFMYSGSPVTLPKNLMLSLLT